jgi:SAM-dependent methyltransferase
VSGQTIYDENVQMYLDFIDHALAEEPSFYIEVAKIIQRVVGDRLRGARVLDVACGEGYLSRFLAPLGPRTITAVDLSERLIDVARERTDAPNVSFTVDDARALTSVDDASMDVVVSQVAMQDIADHAATFGAVRRVIAPGGIFVFSMLHPCFQSPTNIPEGHEPFLLDETGERIAVLAWRYASEGYFMSGGTGVRGTMGSYHRMLSTYLNDLRASGFRLERVEEPVFGEAPGVLAHVPIVMIVAATPET